MLSAWENSRSASSAMLGAHVHEAEWQWGIVLGSGGGGDICSQCKDGMQERSSQTQCVVQEQAPVKEGGRLWALAQ